ncbi:MAG: hypothetical protein U0528_02855 [Anaerolineae bacterium]
MNVLAGVLLPSRVTIIRHPVLTPAAETDCGRTTALNTEIAMITKTMLLRVKRSMRLTPNRALIDKTYGAAND